jgi:hypothetical protein
MKNKKPFRVVPDSPLHQEAQALSLSVAAIRKAQGKKSPADFPVDSPEWHRVCMDFASDVVTFLGGDLADMPDDFTAFELGYDSVGAYKQALEQERREEERRRKE